MKTLLKSWIVRFLALMLAASVALAQDRVPFRQEELDQMLAPIALYPDSLLSQILMASTYPLEVVEASRWSAANPGLKGQDAVHAAERMDWDPSVKSLTAFPQVLTMMNEKLEWTERLGEAFLAQQADVMDSVQALRHKADTAGNLLSSEQMQVARQGEEIYLEPPGPEVVYIPYYDPTVVYGAWWYPAYPPVFWAAPPAYVVYSSRRPGFFWSSGITISAGFFFGHADWRRHRVTVVRGPVTNVTVNRTTVINRPASRSRVAWQPDPAHRRGAPFHNAAARQRFEQARASAPASVAAPASRSAAQPSSNATRQQQTEARRNAVPERRDLATPRAAPSVNSNRSSASSNGERARPPVRRETQGNQANAQAQRPPQAAERRVERREVPRPQPRAVEPRRPAIAAPQAQHAPQAAPHRAEIPGNGNHGPAVRQKPAGAAAPSAAAGAPRQKPAPPANGKKPNNNDHGGRRGDG